MVRDWPRKCRSSGWSRKQILGPPGPSPAWLEMVGREVEDITGVRKKKGQRRMGAGSHAGTSGVQPSPRHLLAAEKVVWAKGLGYRQLPQPQGYTHVSKTHF